MVYTKRKSDTSRYHKNNKNRKLLSIDDVKDHVSEHFDDPVDFSAGTVLLPAIILNGDVNTGIYQIAADNLGVSTGGTKRFDVSTTAISSTLPLRAGDGTAAAPAYSFTSDTDNGLFLAAANNPAISAGGTQRLDVSSTAVTSTLPLREADGTAAAPSYGFTSDTDNGLFLAAANNPAISAGGTQRLDISTTAVTTTLPILGAGSVSAPGYSFSSNTSSGMYTAGNSDVRFAILGVLRLAVTSANISDAFDQTDDAGIVIWYPFQITSAENDYIGPDLVNVGSVALVTSRTGANLGVYQTSMSLNGTSQYLYSDLSLGGASAVAVQNAFAGTGISVSFWVRTTVGTGEIVYFSDVAAGVTPTAADTRYRFYYSAAGTLGFIGDVSGAGTYATYTTSLPIGKWQHVAMSHGASGYTVMVNGSVVTSAATAYQAITVNTIYIGAANATGYLTGNLRDLLVSSTVWSVAQMLEIYELQMLIR